MFVIFHSGWLRELLLCLRRWRRSGEDLKTATLLRRRGGPFWRKNLKELLTQRLTCSALARGCDTNKAINA